MSTSGVIEYWNPIRPISPISPIFGGEYEYEVSQHLTPITCFLRSFILTPRERIIAAFNLKQPDDIVPHFELQFQLSEELLGKKHLLQEELDKASGTERERLMRENAELYVEEAERLDYSIIPINWGLGNLEDVLETMKLVKELVGDNYMVGGMADGTMGIPNGTHMVEVAIRLSEKPDEVHADLTKGANTTIEMAKRMADAGTEVFLMCSDYCFNDGPFLSPRMFSEFVTPYLTRVVAAMREMGAYTVKHTDGDIMPIIDQLVEAQPHAIHSIDPMAGVDLKKVKSMVGDKVALCGNVNCAILQTKGIPEVVADSERALRDGMPGGGFVFTTSNTPFKGMPLENYLAMLDVRKKLGRYD